MDSLGLAVENHKRFLEILEQFRNKIMVNSRDWQPERNSIDYVIVLARRIVISVTLWF
jgi:ABC-type Mn2+/Zn2+ transport system ATPase subunit